jgi:hypothetical protein
LRFLNLPRGSSKTNKIRIFDRRSKKANTSSRNKCIIRILFFVTTNLIEDPFQAESSYDAAKIFNIFIHTVFIVIMRTSVHQPNLSTIRMVEQKLKKRHSFKNKYQLFENLPRQVMYSTLTTILDYLEESNKIRFDRDGSISWIFSGTPKNKATKNLKAKKSVRTVNS